MKLPFVDAAMTVHRAAMHIGASHVQLDLHGLNRVVSNANAVICALCQICGPEKTLNTQEEWTIIYVNHAVKRCGARAALYLKISVK